MEKEGEEEGGREGRREGGEGGLTYSSLPFGRSPF